MKTKTRKLIAAITATAMLGSVLGVGAYAISKTDNDFGFKGTYDLTALAEPATASPVNVAGVDIDVTSTLTLTSTDAAKPYTLFVTVVDNADMTSLTDIKVGYKIGSNYYNGLAVGGLTNVIYSSLTVNTSETTKEKFTAAQLGAAYTSTITKPMLVIAEVNTSLVGSNTAELAIVKSYYKELNVDTTSSIFNIKGTIQACGETEKLTYGNTTFEKALKTDSTALVEFNLTKPGRLTLLVGQKGDNTPGITIDGTLKAPTNNLVTLDLEAGSHKITKGSAKESWLYYINVDTAGEVNTDIPVTYTEVKEVAATCGKAGTEAHYTGSDGKLYQLVDGVYTVVTAEELVIPATGSHTVDEETWKSDATNHWHACSVCGEQYDVAEHTLVDGVCSICGYDSNVVSTETTYTFTNGTTKNDGNPWQWTYSGTYSSTVNKVTYSSSVRVDSSNTLILNAKGSQVTIAMNGFTSGSGNASQYIQVDLLDEYGNSLKTIYGTTGTGKVPGDYTFDDNGVITLESGSFTQIKFSLKSGGKHYGVLSASITVK